MTVKGPRGTRRLFIGGPLDGQWHEVYGRTMRASVPPSLITWPIDDSTQPLIPEQVEYVREVINLFGYSLEVMLAYRELDTWPKDRNQTVLKAILQRDVMAALKPPL